MSEDDGLKAMGQVIQIDEARIRDHLGEMVHGTVEETYRAQVSFQGHFKTSELCLIAAIIEYRRKLLAHRL